MLPFTTLDIRWGKKITPHNAKNRHQSSFNRETRTVQWWIALKSQSMYWNTYPWCKWCTQTVRWRQKKQQSVLDYESSDNSNYWLLKKKKTQKKHLPCPSQLCFFSLSQFRKKKKKKLDLIKSDKRSNHIPAKHHFVPAGSWISSHSGELRTQKL